ncbi:serine hydrolase [Pseudoduganella aquatica]|uniref:Serine hydrolase n=1 Tax=Pseudoduganella aquatica TaxID=2660641 RepID=A0A7X4HF63_9BURK|nr:serine hydrolase [Pseudoduganella aquatica]MYN09844.1 serine hydrolase [Pseudoduganella aquatica]
MKRVLTAVVFLIALLEGASAGAASGRGGSVEGQVDRYLQSEMRERRIPGLQLAVVKGGKIVMLKSFGLAELPHSLPVTKRSVFSINSATKSFTGVAILQLVEQGKLDLNAPVSRYLSDLPGPWQGVTITQLLNHTSGIPDIISQKTSRLATGDSPDAAWRQVQTLPMDFAPGERFSYNQTNYLLLGKIIDQLSGQPFAQFIQQRQFDAAGMRQTGYGDVHDVIPDKAPSYRFDADGKTLKQVTDDFPAMLRTGAGINSTAQDLARWIISLQKGALVSPAGLAQMWQRGRFNDGKPAPWSLGWPAIRDKEYRAVAGIGGMRSAFYVYPEHDLAVVILTNLAGSSPEQMIDIVASFFLPELRSVSGGYATYRLREQANVSGFERLDEKLAQLKKQSGIAQPSEDELNGWGYRLLGAGQKAQAVAVMSLATRLYPDSFNTYDSLAEVYEAAGERDLARQNYKRSLALNPLNTHAVERLRVLDQASAQ